MAAKKKKKTVTKRRKKNDEAPIQVYGAIGIVFSLIVLLHERTGFLGQFFFQCSRFVFGEFYYLFYFYIILFCLFICLTGKYPQLSTKQSLGLFLLYATLLLITAIPEGQETGKEAYDLFFGNARNIYENGAYSYGGCIAALIYSGISLLVNYLGTMIIIVAMAISGILLLLDMDKVRNLFSSTTQKVRETAEKKKNARKAKVPNDVTVPKKKEDDAIIIDSNLPVKETTISLGKTPVKMEPKTDTVPVKPAEKEKPADTPVKTTNSTGGGEPYKNYQKPRISLLENPTAKGGTANKNNARAKGDMVIDILNQFDVPCSLQAIRIGPSVTKFEIKPEGAIKVNKITSLQNNLKMGLEVTDVRIEAPIPGKNAIGIEIPNVERTTVCMKELLNNVPEKIADKPLAVALGKDLSGENIYMELDKMPHILIAGSTGSGKSVCINSIIISLLLRTTPDEVKLLLIDPKKVEFTPYVDIPNLIGPVITDTSDASTALKTIVNIMDNRYTTFHNAGVRDVREYNKLAEKDPTKARHMPYIVVIIDELADLMITNGKDVEASIQRITQLARASGIHLIVATQRPSTDVITGTIKTNIPSRIAFAVASAIDSRIILDQIGAESLLGYGDMLYIPMGETATRRVQGVFVSDNEIKKITDYVKSQGKPMYDDAFVVGENGDVTYNGQTSADPLYDDVKKFVMTTGKASTSSIQRYFGFGYNRAARIMDYLEQEGVIGPSNGSKPREVLMRTDD